MLAKYLFLVPVFLIPLVKTDDAFVEEMFQKCYETKRPYFCVQYKLLKYVDDLEFPTSENGSVKLVKLKSREDEVLAMPRHMDDDPEYLKFWKFVGRKLITFVSSYALAFEVPEGTAIVEGRTLDKIDFDDGLAKEEERGARGKQRKKILIISIIIMAKLLKVKMILAMVFFTLISIKKVILFSAIAFPTILNHLKFACQTHKEAHGYSYPTVIESAETAYPSAYPNIIGLIFGTIFSKIGEHIKDTLWNKLSTPLSYIS